MHQIARKYGTVGRRTSTSNSEDVIAKENRTKLYYSRYRMQMDLVKKSYPNGWATRENFNRRLKKQKRIREGDASLLQGRSVEEYYARPVSGALTSTEGDNGSSATTPSSASATLPVVSADTKDKEEKPETPKAPTSTKEKVEEPRPEPPKVATPTRDRVEEPSPEPPKVPISTRESVEQSKPEPPKVPTPTKPADLSSPHSISPKPVKPADLSYPSAPVAQSEKRIPPEPSRPPPSLSEPKIVSSVAPPLSTTKSVSAPLEAKTAPPPLESKPVPSQPKPAFQEPQPAPTKLETPPSSPAVCGPKSIPNKESEKVEIKPVQPIGESPKVEEVLLKPKIVQEVEREVTVTEVSKDFEDEDEYEYEEEEVEEEDIDDYDDHLAKETKPHLQLPHQTQQVRSPLKVEDYDSEDDIITNIDRLDDKIVSESEIVKST